MALSQSGKPAKHSVPTPPSCFETPPVAMSTVSKSASSTQGCPGEPPIDMQIIPPRRPRRHSDIDEPGRQFVDLDHGCPRPESDPHTPDLGLGHRQLPITTTFNVERHLISRNDVVFAHGPELDRPIESAAKRPVGRAVRTLTGTEKY
jgi:hypothetical protein